jgi:hypothetical protein
MERWQKDQTTAAATCFWPRHVAQRLTLACRYHAMPTLMPTSARVRWWPSVCARLAKQKLLCKPQLKVADAGKIKAVTFRTVSMVLHVLYPGVHQSSAAVCVAFHGGNNLNRRTGNNGKRPSSSVRSALLRHTHRVIWVHAPVLSQIAPYLCTE